MGSQDLQAETRTPAGLEHRLLTRGHAWLIERGPDPGLRRLKPNRSAAGASQDAQGGCFGPAVPPKPALLFSAPHC